MNNKTYNEIYKKDIETIKKEINNKSIFDFKKEKDGTIIINNAYYIGHYIQDFINTTLNPNLLEDATIEIINNKMKNLYQDNGVEPIFHTNIGVFETKYCFIDNDVVEFYDDNRNLVASINKESLKYIKNYEYGENLMG